MDINNLILLKTSFSSPLLRSFALCCFGSTIVSLEMSEVIMHREDACLLLFVLTGEHEIFGSVCRDNLYQTAWSRAIVKATSRSIKEPCRWTVERRRERNTCRDDASSSRVRSEKKEKTCFEVPPVLASNDIRLCVRLINGTQFE